jgi:integrase/recombinase XerD
MMYEHVNGCIESEKERGLSKETLKELKRYLHEFANYCQTKLDNLEDMTSDYLREYVMIRGKDRGKDLKKAVVWSLRKLGGYLVLRGILMKNPAKPLRHPKRSPREHLPEFLKKYELRDLLFYSSTHLCQQDFMVVALLCSTGMRPSAIEALKRNCFSYSQKYIIEKAKGGGFKKTALNDTVCDVLQDYLKTRKDNSPAMFLTDRQKPVSIGWVQMLVKKTGINAGLSRLTCNIIRHTFAVYAADRHGKTITKALMGHRKLSTTAVYTHLSARHFKRLMNTHPFMGRLS